MKLSDVSIQRPVLAWVMSILLVLFGLVGLTRLSVREYPDIDPPIVSVTTVYQGANPQVIESTVTEPLEDEITSIEGIKSLVSKSAEQVSTIIIEFELDRDINVAAQDVRDRVARARGQLPQDVDEPLVVKQDADAQAIMWLSLSGKDFSQLQISDYANRYIVDQLQTVPGVGRVIIGGERKYAMRLWLDPVKMAARHVTVLDVRDALEAKNVEIPSGRIEGETREFTVRTLGELQTPEAFNSLIVKAVEGAPVYLRDVGRAEVGPRDDRSLVRFNGKPAVGLGIVKQSKANTVEVAHGVKEKLKEIRKTLPQGLGMETAYDSSTYIEQSIHEVIESLLLASGLVILVIWLFLGTLRATLIPAVAIPVSIIGTFFVMERMGFSINILTLLALNLAIGLVVDDNIVVLENIVRWIQMGFKPLEAAVKGTREIAFAVLATTIVLVAVFLPLAFMTGTTGRLFLEFSIAVAGSVVISMFVSLTLAPMLCSRMLRPEDEKEKAADESTITKRFSFIRQLERFEQQYQAALAWAFGHKRWIALSVGVTLLLSGVSFFLSPKEFLPTEDRSQIFTILEAPVGSTLAYTDRALKQAEAIYAATPEVLRYFSVIALSAEGVGSVNSGFMFVTLKPKAERKTSQQNVVNGLIPKMFSIPQAFVFPINPPSGPSRGFGKPIQLVIEGFNNQELDRVAGRIMQRAQKEVFGLINLESDLKLNKPQLEITVNREKAAELGVSVRDIASTLRILLGGLDLSTFTLNGKRYDVMVQMPPTFRVLPEQIGNIYVQTQPQSLRTPGVQLLGRQLMGPASLVPLANLVSIKESVAPKELNHYDRLRAATISGSLIPIPGLSLGGVLEKLQSIARQEMSPDMRLAWAGESKEYFSSQTAILQVFALALLVVFLALAAQFESFIQPMIVMLTVPLAVCGALISLQLFGVSLNVYSEIGMVLLVGLVTKNGILIVEYANQILARQTQEASTETHTMSWPERVQAAIQQSAAIRLRPILMTSVATIFGAMPIALALGAGAESRQGLGIAVVGGMALSTFLTLFVVPIAYQLIVSRLKQPKMVELPE